MAKKNKYKKNLINNETRKVVLLKPHEHDGVMYNVGDEIELSKTEADWLKSLYVAERIDNNQKLIEIFGEDSTLDEEK